MPPKKKKRTQKKTISNGTSHDANQESVTDVSVQEASRDSQFLGFLDGQNGHMVTSSPGQNPHINKQDEAKAAAISIAEERLRLTEEAICLRFDSMIAALESTEAGRTAVWEEGDDLVDVVQSLLESTKAEEVQSRSHVTSASRNRGVTPHTEFTSGRSRRRSKSADGFQFNIATVLPHPQHDQPRIPASILRKPKFGETAISMAGSPLVVHSDQVVSASLVLPLADGRVFNVRADCAHDIMEQIRANLDSETINQLERVFDLINCLLRK